MDGTLQPRTVSGWIRDLWNQILFPGSPPTAPTAFSVWRVLMLLFVPGLLLYPGLSFRLIEPDESRYAQIPREMLARGDAIVPTLQGDPYLDKPPLFYWLVMGSYTVFGVHDWAARLIPALAIHATILVTYLLGRRSLGDKPAWWAAWVLALTPGLTFMARLLILDGLLTLCCTVALLAAFEAVRSGTLHRGWWLLSAVACAFGVLTKGPIALVLLVPPLWFHARLTGTSLWPGWKAWSVFLLVVIAIALPWYAALSYRIPSFPRYFFWEHNLQRFMTNYAHSRGVWFYVPVLFLALLPLSLLVVSLLRFLISSDPGTRAHRPAELGFHLLGGSWCVFFFSLSSGKLPTYILPALPLFALVVGQFLVATARSERRSTYLALESGFVILMLLNHLALPWYADYRSPMSRPAEVIARCRNPQVPVVCYPRNCDSIAFYLGRSDLKCYRSKEIEELRHLVRTRYRTVILCTHRHSLEGLKQLLPADVRIVEEVRMGLPDIPGVPTWAMKPLKRLLGETALGLGDLAVVEAPWLRPVPVAVEERGESPALADRSRR